MARRVTSLDVGSRQRSSYSPTAPNTEIGLAFPQATQPTLINSKPFITAPKNDASLYGMGPQLRLYSAAELDALPPVEWLIHDAVPKSGIIGVIGAKGAMKTFVALDLALHAATGRSWHGRVVAPGAVVYVYAEGASGAKARIGAWCEHHRCASGRAICRADLPVWLLPSPVPLNAPGTAAALIDLIANRLSSPPVLVVIDTLNANLLGDEDGRGMGGFVMGCLQLRDAFSATVAVVHHTPLGSDDRGRGHSAFDGALDTRLIVRRDGNSVTVKCTHQRNGEQGWCVGYEAIPVGGSLVLNPSIRIGDELKGQRRDLLRLVSDQGPLSYTSWLKASTFPTPSFKKARKWLVDKRYVEESDKKYSATEAGRLALGTRGIPEGYSA